MNLIFWLFVSLQLTSIINSEGLLGSHLANHTRGTPTQDANLSNLEGTNPSFDNVLLTEIEQLPFDQSNIKETSIEFLVGEPVSDSTITAVYYTHAILMIIVWGFGLDSAMMIARYNKDTENYTRSHGKVMFGIILFTFVSEIGLILFGMFGFDLQRTSPKTAHLIIAICILSVMIIQGFLGYFLRKRITSTLFSKHIRLLTKCHRFSGYALLISGKIQMILGSFVMGWIQLLVVLGLMGLVTASWFVKEREYRQTQEEMSRNSTKEEIIVLTPKQEKLVALLNGLYASSNEAHDLHTVSTILEQPEHGVNKILWVILDNKIYDLTNFHHPGGAFVIQAVKGREIGRFFYGAYGIELYDDITHTHSSRAAELLQKMYIGELKPLFKVVAPVRSGESPAEKSNDDSDDDEVKSEEPVSMKMAPNKKQDRNSRDLQKVLLSKTFNVSYDWKLKTKEELQNNLTKFTFESFGRCRINQSYQSLSQFGQHFKISHAKRPKWRLYSLLLSQTPQNIILRKEFLSYFESIMHGNSSQYFLTKWAEFGSTLPFIIKAHDFPGAFSKFLHEESYNGKDDFALSGPHGFGLGLFKELKGHHIIFCAGTGIFPFLDLLDLILRKTICDVIKERAGETYAKPLYPFCKLAKEVIRDDFKISLFASFVEDEDYMAKDIIEPLSEISANYQLDLFQIYLSCGNSSLINSILQGNTRFNEDFMANHLDLQADRVYVCGPPKFNHDLPKYMKNVNFDPNKIVLV